MILYVVIAIIAVLVIYLIVQYNAFVKANNIVKEAFSTMDVYLKKRYGRHRHSISLNLDA